MSDIIVSKNGFHQPAVNGDLSIKLGDLNTTNPADNKVFIEATTKPFLPNTQFLYQQATSVVIPAGGDITFPAFTWTNDGYMPSKRRFVYYRVFGTGGGTINGVSNGFLSLNVALNGAAFGGSNEISADSIYGFSGYTKITLANSRQFGVFVENGDNLTFQFRLQNNSNTSINLANLALYAEFKDNIEGITS